MSNWRVALSEPEYGPEEEAAVLRVLRSRWFTMGAEVQSFERQFADAVGLPHAVATSNGTAALHLVLAALGVSPGDEVIQPSVNFVASANMTRALGATPVFADIVSVMEPTIDPAAVERLVTPRTKVVVAMHYGGYTCRMDRLHDLCADRGIALVEDACHAPGARYHAEGHELHDRRAGNLSTAGCFSFFSNKNLTTGEGGMVTTGSESLAREIRLRRSHGMTTSTLDRDRGHAYSYDVTAVGFNYRPTEFTGALGQAQLARLTEANERRRALDRVYRESLATVPGLVVPFAGQTGEPACHLMPVLLPPDVSREAVMQSLREAGVQSSIHYPTIHTMSAYREHSSTDLPNSVAYCQRELTLPLFPTLRHDQLELVVDSLGASLTAYAEQQTQ